MAICLLGAIKESEEKVRVGVIHYKPEKLDEAQREAGIMIVNKTQADIPQPEYRKGKTSVLYFNPKAETFWYEYVDRPLTQEEAIMELVEKIDALLEKHDEAMEKQDAVLSALWQMQGIEGGEQKE